MYNHLDMHHTFALYFYVKKFTFLEPFLNFFASGSKILMLGYDFPEFATSIICFYSINNIVESCGAEACSSLLEHPLNGLSA
jgi:hypothetical protein